MTYHIDYAYFCHNGKLRSNNEDNFWCQGHMLDAVHTGGGQIYEGSTDSASLPVFAVFDGMGGESSGEIASWLGARAMDDFLSEYSDGSIRDIDAFLRRISHYMNHAVCTYQEEHRIISMGSTMACIAFSDSQLGVCNLGDSRIFRHYGGHLYRISHDHVLGQSLYGKAPLTQYLGLPEKEMELEPAVSVLPCREGEVFLLCTDGITDMLKEGQIQDILTRSGREGGLETAARELLDCALAAGGRDNATAFLCRLSRESRRTFGGSGLAGWLGRIFGGTRRKGGGCSDE